MNGPANPERAFGVAVGTVLMLIAAVATWRGRVLTAEIMGGTGLVLFVLGRLRPLWLTWPSRWWWRFALALGYVNARVILTLAFALVFVPLGVAWRVTGRDPLGRSRANWQGWTPYPARYRDRHHFTRMF